MKRPHFDVLLHKEELSRPQKVQEQIRKNIGSTNIDRIISESGENKKPIKGFIRIVEWTIIMIVISIMFCLWIF